MHTVDVVIDRVASGLNRSFSYAVPDGLEQIGPGWRVMVPLGNGRAQGLVVRVGETEWAPKIKSVIKALDAFPLLTPDLVQLALWMTDRWSCFLPQALRAVVPAPVRRVPPPAPLYLYPGSKPNRGPERLRLWNRLSQDPGLAVDVALALTGVSRAVLRSMERQGQITRGSRLIEPVNAATHRLTPPQQAAVDRIRTDLQGDGAELLVEGVTGSGKTEVYLEAIAATLQQGRQAIVLVPEIALTPQMAARFNERFPGRVAIFHSAMAEGQRVTEWHRVRTGEASVVLGARSAVFAPCPRLGLIVMDEEHEATYKQDEHPRYHARDVARKRIQLTQGVLVLGSATPSLESAWAARRGKIGWARLPERIGGGGLARVTMVDMRQELRDGHREMFSRPLQLALTGCLNDQGQAILLLNRRGFSTSVVCRECGQASTCPSCSVSLTLHRTERQLVCHYCSHQESIPTVCPSCGSGRIRQFGVGTEQVVAEVGRLWPQARVIRADTDSLRQRGSHQRLFETFGRGQADILVGTQVVAKGMDWPRVTVVGIVAADLALTLPDFRAAERTFSLLTQAAGRAGRGKQPGSVIIQTYNPDHYSVMAAAAQDFDRFYDAEIAFREMLGYPPFGHLLLVEATDAVEQKARDQAEAAHQSLEAAKGVIVLGPAPAPVERVRGQWRQHLLVKAETLQPLLTIARTLLAANPRLSLTVDPHHLM